MMISKMFLAFLFLLPCLPALLTGSDIEVFLALSSGHYSNDADLAFLEDNGVRTKQNAIDVDFRILQLPVLDWNYVVYIEKYVDDVLAIQQIFHLTEVGHIIQVQQYNLTKPEDFVPGTFDMSKLETLTADDLRTSNDCKGFIRRIDETVFIMQVPDCSAYGETSARYSITFTCNSVGFIITPNTFLEDSSRIPYRTVKDKSYPVSSAIVSDQDLTRRLCGQ